MTKNTATQTNPQHATLERQARELCRALWILDISVERDGDALRFKGHRRNLETLVQLLEHTSDKILANKGRLQNTSGQLALFDTATSVDRTSGHPKTSVHANAGGPVLRQAA